MNYAAEVVAPASLPWHAGGVSTLHHAVEQAIHYHDLTFQSPGNRRLRRHPVFQTCHTLARHRQSTDWFVPRRGGKELIARRARLLSPGAIGTPVCDCRIGTMSRYEPFRITRSQLVPVFAKQLV